MGYELKTINKFDYYEVISAFQKSIRRGDEENAVFWGVELFESGYIGHLWNRIFIIASEDIGLAEDNFVGKIIALKQSYDYLEKHRPKKVSKNLVLLQTIITLVRAKKSRYVDLAYSVYWSEHNNIAINKKIPDFAFDMHTKQGRIYGRGLDHFYSEGAKINNRAYITGETEFEELAKNIDIKNSQKKVEEKNNPDTNPSLF